MRVKGSLSPLPLDRRVPHPAVELQDGVSGAQDAAMVPHRQVRGLLFEPNVRGNRPVWHISPSWPLSRQVPRPSLPEAALPHRLLAPATFSTAQLLRCGAPVIPSVAHCHPDCPRLQDLRNPDCQIPLFLRQKHSQRVDVLRRQSPLFRPPCRFDGPGALWDGLGYETLLGIPIHPSMCLRGASRRLYGDVRVFVLVNNVRHAH